jgi:hypothetical protein
LILSIALLAGASCSPAIAEVLKGERVAGKSCKG